MCSEICRVATLHEPPDVPLVDVVPDPPLVDPDDPDVLCPSRVGVATDANTPKTKQHSCNRIMTNESLPRSLVTNLVMIGSILH